MKKNDDESTAPPAASTNAQEEECVICLEPLSDNFSWGRCTPCRHAFHKSCWWQWENAHNERVHKSRRRGEIPPGELRPPKCCLCNAVNDTFVDVEGLPVTNPEPFVPSEDENNEEDGSSFFSRMGSMSFNPESLTLENIQQAIRNADIGIPPQLVNDPIFLRELSEYSLGLLNGGGGQGGDDSDAVQRGMDALNPSGIFQRMFGGVDGSAAAAAAPYNNAQSNTNNDDVGPPFNELRQGTPVVTQNLTNGPNGRQGTIVRLDSSNGRYLVRLRPTATGVETTVAIKPENVLQMVRVKVHGLQSQPQLNGSDGQIISYSSERDRYVVRVAYIDQEVLRSLPPHMQLEVSLHPRETRDISVSSNNIRIAVGTPVRLDGLVQGVQWNGRYGRVTKWIDGGEGGVGRYEVRLSRQHAVQVRPQNVRL